MKDYQVSINELYEKLKTNSLGLTDEEAKKRLNNNNFIYKQKSFNFFYLFNDYTTIVLFFIAIFSIFVSHIRKESLFVSFILLIMVFLNIFLSILFISLDKINEIITFITSGIAAIAKERDIIKISNKFLF